MLYSELSQITENLNSLAHFIEKSINHESNQLKISDLKTKTDDLLKLVKHNENKIKAIESLLSPIDSYDDTKYLAGSKLSATNKGHEVLRRLEALDFNFSEYGYISLGGGDGTELYTVIENSNINFGVLLEYDFESVNKFAQNYIPFKLKNFKRWEKINLEVIECDLFDKNKLDTTKHLINHNKPKGIIVSVHAVLHELSTRSQLKSQFLKNTGEVNLEEFFREIFEWHENIILVVREPGIPENWKENPIYLKIGNEHKENFLKILDEINNLHFNGASERNYINRERANDISCRPDLAIEALTKLFYLKDYQYEKRERVTSVSRAKIVTALKSSRFKIERSEPFFTGSIEANMKQFQVTVEGENNFPLSLPQCFTYTIASSGNHHQK